MVNTDLPPGFVPKSTALSNTFVSHKSSNALVKRHLVRNTFTTIYGVDVRDIDSTAFNADPLQKSEKVSAEFVDSLQVVENAVWFVEPQAFKKNQTISVDCERLELSVDEDCLKRILINLLSNAIKFSPANSSIEISVSLMHGVAVFSVKDEGIGIPAENLETIFQPSRRVSKKASGAAIGNGLGLPICKELVESYGGEIGVGSGEMGSYFWFTAPLA